MKVEFDKEEIEAMLIAKAQSFGINVNAVKWDSSPYTRSAVVFYDAQTHEATPNLVLKETRQA